MVGDRPRKVSLAWKLIVLLVESDHGSPSQFGPTSFYLICIRIKSDLCIFCNYNLIELYLII